MIKVLQIGMSTNYGGLESFVINMYRHINRDKIQFDFVNVYDTPLAYEDEYVELGAKILRITKRDKNPIRSYVQLKKLIYSGEYDYVHFHCMNFCWWDPIIIAGSKKSPAKLIVHSHLTGFNENSPKKEIILHEIGKHLTSRSNYIRIACGNNAGKWLFGNKTFTVINNGIDTKKYSFSGKFRTEIRNKYKINDNRIVIGHVGNFSFQKNYPLLIDIFNEMKKIDSRYLLMLVGDERRADEVKERIIKYSLSDSVIFTGILKDVHKYYSGMDLYIYPSSYEGLNISLIEAQCSGLQCFFSNTLDSETDVSGNCTTIDISCEPRKIAKFIIHHLQNIDRNNAIININYEVSTAVKKLEKIYIDHCK